MSSELSATRARELDQLMERFHKLASEAVVSWWKTAKLVAAIHDSGLYRARYATWEAFVEAELRVTVGHAQNWVRLAREFKEERAVRLGMSKCILLLKANEEVRPKLEAKVKRGSIKTDAELRREVVKANRALPTGTAGKNVTDQQAFVRVKLGRAKVARMKALAADRGVEVEQIVVEAVDQYLSRF